MDYNLEQECRAWEQHRLENEARNQAEMLGLFSSDMDSDEKEEVVEKLAAHKKRWRDYLP